MYKHPVLSKLSRLFITTFCFLDISHVKPNRQNCFMVITAVTVSDMKGKNAKNHIKFSKSVIKQNTTDSIDSTTALVVWRSG